jgi:OOP family OmpA-OmpF porin
MKRILFLLVLMAAIFNSNAQFGSLVNKIKDKVKQGTVKKEEKGAETSSSNIPVNDSLISQDTPKGFARYDFIPGDQIIYIADLEGEAEGELPSGWNTKGTGEVVKMTNTVNRWLRLHHPFTYLSSNKNEFGENYTIEFDLFMQLKNNGWAYPTFSVGLFSSDKETANDNHFLDGYKKYQSAEVTLFPGEYRSTRLIMQSFVEGKSWFKSDVKPFDALEKWYGRPVHIAIQVQKERFRMWLNEIKAFDIPKGMAQKYIMNQVLFSVGQTNYKEDQYGIYISNIKIAKGIPDTRHKLIEEGKYSTTAILFNVNAATIRPESAGQLKEIAEVLKQNPDVRIKIIGHTDSDGNDALNLQLSKKRAEAVKASLTDEYGIEESRIETDGNGEKKPVADNNTKEGKAANRRVEFIKL